LPGISGEFEVLEGHTPLLAALKTGIVTVSQPKNVDQTNDLGRMSVEQYRLMIAEGFAEIDTHHVTVLCEAAALPSEINIESERALLQHLQDKMKQLSEKDEKEFLLAQAEIEQATVKLSLM